MSQIEVLILELHAVDGLSSSTVASGEISALSHEIFDDAMERWPLIVKWLSRLAHALLTSAEGSEVLSSLRHLISEQLNDYSTRILTTKADIEVDVWVCHANKYVLYNKYKKDSPFYTVL